MWELDHKESWVPKNWYFWTVMLDYTVESPLDCKEIQPVHPKGNQYWIFNGRTDAEAATPILWLPDGKNWLIEKTLSLGKIEGGRRRGWQRTRWLDGITNSMDMSLSKFRSWWWTGKPGMLQSKRVGTQLSNWTEANIIINKKIIILRGKESKLSLFGGRGLAHLPEINKSPLKILWKKALKNY